LRNLLGLVFVFSGFIKLVDLVWFSGIVSSYGVLPDFLVLPFSFLVSFFEFIFGLMLLFEIVDVLGGWLGVGMTFFICF